MSEIDQAKERINASAEEGILTEHLREDYEPAGDLMIRELVDSGNYVTRKVPMHSWDAK